MNIQLNSTINRLSNARINAIFLKRIDKPVFTHKVVFEVVFNDSNIDRISETHKFESEEKAREFYDLISFEITNYLNKQVIMLPFSSCYLLPITQ